MDSAARVTSERTPIVVRGTENFALGYSDWAPYGPTAAFFSHAKNGNCRKGTRLTRIAPRPSLQFVVGRAKLSRQLCTKVVEGSKRVHKRDAPSTHSHALRPRPRASCRARRPCASARRPLRCARRALVFPPTRRTRKKSPSHSERDQTRRAFAHADRDASRPRSHRLPHPPQADVAASVVESATLHGTLPAPLSHIQVRARSNATRRRVPRPFV